jgi:SAM-dependent methyltransferase
MKSPFLPSKLTFVKKHFGNKAFKLLDVGTGNHSASEVHYYLPKCQYHGVDITRNYNNSEKDFSLMRRFWKKDLTQLEFYDIPDNFFDAILMAHIVEHLHNGDLVIKALIPKLKKGGVIYIEYPSAKSLSFPSRRGTLNFRDDPTHVRIYSVSEISGILSQNCCSVLKSGTWQRWLNILLMPFKMVHNKIKYKYVTGSTYWDWYGFAEFVFAKKLQ